MSKWSRVVFLVLLVLVSAMTLRNLVISQSADAISDSGPYLIAGTARPLLDTGRPVPPWPVLDTGRPVPPWP